jgi:transcriptional regulator with XRE-family HTH domain
MKEKLIEIGSRIRQIRKEQNLNQVALGNKLGLSAQAISKYENGESDAGAITLSKIATIGGVSLDWLLTGVESIQQGSSQPIVSEGQTDTELWQAVIETVEEHLQGNDQQLAPAKKAELITTLYEMFAEEEEKQVDKKTVAKLIRLAS